jgi:starch synthase (maltosyl-transferring)
MRTMTTQANPTSRASVADRRRVVVERVLPSVDGGRFPIKRIVGDVVDVEAHVFADGHDVLSVRLLWRHETDPAYEESALRLRYNDEWLGSFPVTRLGRYRFNVEAWVDPFLTWRRDLEKRRDAQQDLTTELVVGARLVEATVETAPPEARKRLGEWAVRLRDPQSAEEPPLAEIDETLVPLMATHGGRPHAVRFERDLEVAVDPERARASAWYEVFPRSTSATPGKHGDFASLRERLPYIRGLGFDVLYLPPIHPIGRAFRKGKNNAVKAVAGDVGSPWAIGGPEGGHKSIHPELGTLDEFRALLKDAKRQGLDIALDLAFQCSPDHPYVKEHPEWFRHKPDGTIQYAENPPKKYQDIYPFDFEGEHADALWQELRSVVDFWIAQGVRIFRVDNPHTKPFPFWQWLIGEVKQQHPDVLFLAEAFTRPKPMYRLAKLGFSHSYTYFAWRNRRDELTEYLTELHTSPVSDIFRPHLWVNTPDILTEYLQTGGRAGTMARFVLAATLGANYGVYGPAFELVETQATERGKEEYRDSEKYQIRTWDLDRPGHIRDLVAHVNRIRRENPALHDDRGLRFQPIDNDQLIGYSRHSPDGTNSVLVFVNLDPHHEQGGWTDLDLPALGLERDEEFQVHDLLTDARYLWKGARNYIALRPEPFPAHIFHIRRRMRTERDFDYFG